MRWTAESRAIQAEKIAATWRDPTVRERRTAPLRGSKRTPEARAKMAERKREKWKDPEYRARMVESAKNRNYRDPAAFAEQMRAKTIALWQDPAYRAKVIPEGIRPSRLELSLVPLLEAHGYSHTGAGDYWIVSEGRTRNPDFKKHGERRVIEVFGDWWHRDDRGREPEIIGWYERAGYACLIVWESEVDSLPTMLENNW